MTPKRRRVKKRIRGDQPLYKARADKSREREQQGGFRSFGFVHIWRRMPTVPAIQSGEGVSRIFHDAAMVLRLSAHLLSQCDCVNGCFVISVKVKQLREFLIYERTDRAAVHSRFFAKKIKILAQVSRF